LQGTSILKVLMDEGARKILNSLLDKRRHASIEALPAS
jgi:hypothetical protein